MAVMRRAFGLLLCCVCPRVALLAVTEHDYHPLRLACEDGDLAIGFQLMPATPGCTADITKGMRLACVELVCCNRVKHRTLTPSRQRSWRQTCSSSEAFLSTVAVIQVAEQGPGIELETAEELGADPDLEVQVIASMTEWWHVIIGFTCSDGEYVPTADLPTPADDDPLRNMDMLQLECPLMHAICGLTVHTRDDQSPKHADGAAGADGLEDVYNVVHHVHGSMVLACCSATTSLSAATAVAHNSMPTTSKTPPVPALPVYVLPSPNVADTRRVDLPASDKLSSVRRLLFARTSCRNKQKPCEL